MFANEFVCNILEYIEININNSISVDQISNVFGYEKSYIMKKFKKELGITIINYINIMRILNSLRGFYEYNSFLDIAINNGFNSLEYYSEIFKKVIKVSPRSYKKFIKRDNNLTLTEFETILNSLAVLNALKKRIKKYRTYIKHDTSPILKLAITRSN